MQSLREDRLEIGGVRVEALPEALTLENGEPDEVIRLDPDGVIALLQFLRGVILSANDRRRAYRVPVPEACGFRTTLFNGTRSIPCETHDISLTGIFLEPVSHTEVRIELGSAVRVLVEFDGESVVTEATVVRSSGAAYGLNFTGAGSGEELDPLPGLARVMMKLEHYWAMEGWKRESA